MNFKIKLLFCITITMIPLMSFGAGKFIYGFRHDPRYINKKEIGSDLIVMKKFEDGTQEDMYWRIRPEDLPVTEYLCNENTFDLCLEEEEAECFKPCLSYGPQLVTYAKNMNKIYFTIDTTEVGATGIGSRLLFVGDLIKKQLKLLTITDGFLKATYSPNERYIVFSRSLELYVVNTSTDETFIISNKFIRTKKYREVHYLKNVHWISSHTFTYLDKN